MNHKEIPEKPILMSAPMVKATLADLKTQTRRIVKPQPLNAIFHKGKWIQAPCEADNKGHELKCPYGQPGHRLWVRERHKYMLSTEGEIIVEYFADKNIKFIRDNEELNEIIDGIIDKNRPSIFLHRFASRIILEITDIRIERLQDISEDDARAEGCDLEWYHDNAGEENLWPCPDCNGLQVHGALGPNLGMTEVDCQSCDTSKKMFQHLWESINGKPKPDKPDYSWKQNCWVWVVEFKRVTE